LRGLVASAATGAAGTDIGVVHDETGPIGGLHEIDDTGVQDLLGLSVIIQSEPIILLFQIAILLALLEGHPELGSGAAHPGKVDLDAISLFVVLGDQIVDVLGGLWCDFYHLRFT
jgi:hypothetical protein